MRSGPAELPLLGGIRVELTVKTTVIPDTDNFGVLLLENQPAASVFLSNPLDFDGNTPETVDDLVALLSESTTEVTEIESTVIDGIDARVFEISARASRGALKRNPTMSVAGAPHRVVRCGCSSTPSAVS